MRMSFEDYKKNIIRRYDDDGIIKLFSYKDFNGLKVKRFNFTTLQKSTIKSYLYFYSNYNKKDLIIFSHGLGGGHRSYMREIDVLCKKGYRVLTYDLVGCFSSSGKSINALTESINDLSCCLEFVKNNKKLKNLNLILIGHSLGGFAVGNILSFYKGIKKVVAISPFNSINDFAQSLFKNDEIAKEILNYEKSVYPQYAECTMSNALQNTNVNTLIIHSTNDTVIRIENGLYKIKKNVNNPLVKYLIVEGKNHNPNYKKESVDELNKVFDEYNLLISQGKLSTIKEKKKYMSDKDFYFMTNQDENVWNTIFDFIK